VGCLVEAVQWRGAIPVPNSLSPWQNPLGSISLQPARWASFNSFFKQLAVFALAQSSDVPFYSKVVLGIKMVILFESYQKIL